VGPAHKQAGAWRREDPASVGPATGRAITFPQQHERDAAARILRRLDGGRPAGGRVPARRQGLPGGLEDDAGLTV
jgi:hypothetical protein